jgi:hypothetical protein
VRNGDVSGKSPEWQSHADKKDGQDCLQLSVCNGFTGPKVSIHPLMISMEPITGMESVSINMAAARLVAGQGTACPARTSA